jgi:zinc transport system permease protein
MAYFGDTMAHSALLGVALSLLMISTCWHQRLRRRGGGIAASAAAAEARHAVDGRAARHPVAFDAGDRPRLVAFMTLGRIDLVGFLFGDILAVSRADIDLVWGGGILVVAPSSGCGAR